MDPGEVPDLPARPTTVKATPSPAAATPKQSEVDEQARMLQQYEAQQAALKAAREAEERRRLELEAQQQLEFEQRQREQAERERLAQEQLMQQQMAQYSNAAAQRAAELDRELLAMRGQYERDQLLLEQYDRVSFSLVSKSSRFDRNFQRVKALEGDLVGMNAHVGSQMASKDELIKQLQDQVTLWRNKYEALAKLYSQLRTEHLDMLSKSKQLQIKANSAQEAVDRMERMERDIKAKNIELADMIRERDRARFDVDRQKGSHKEEVDRLRRDLSYAKEREEDAIRSKNNQVSGVLSKYERQINELEDSLRVRTRVYFLHRSLTNMIAVETNSNR